MGIHALGGEATNGQRRHGCKLTRKGKIEEGENCDALKCLVLRGTSMVVRLQLYAHLVAPVDEGQWCGGRNVFVVDCPGYVCILILNLPAEGLS